MAGKEIRAWRHKLPRWHTSARIVAALVLLDQWASLGSSIPSSEAIVVACIGAMFAPIPTEKKRD
jgi:hypothetical protein